MSVPKFIRIKGVILRVDTILHVWLCGRETHVKWEGGDKFNFGKEDGDIVNEIWDLVGVVLKKDE